ncbi:MAG: oligosaccharide flippase family protein [Vicinamibacterales bacterium]
MSKASVVVAFVWLARTLDPGVYGDVEWALSLMMVFTLVADVGLNTWATTEIAAKPEGAAVLVARIGWLRLTLAVPAYLLLLGIGWSRGGDATSAVAVYGVVLFLAPLFLQYLFNGLFQPRWAALGSALRGITFAVAVMLLVKADSPPVHVAIAELLGATALALCSLLVLRYVFHLRVWIRDGYRDMFHLVARSWTIGAIEVAWSVLWYAGLILLGYLATSEDTAWHSANLRLIIALHTGVWLYFSVLLPNLARLLRHDSPGWTRTIEQSFRFTSWISCSIALVGTLAAGTILTTVYGPLFAAAIPELRAAIWILPVTWMSGHIRYSLIAAQHPQRDYHAALVGVAVMLVLTLLLAPSLRSFGTGLALLAGTAANWVAAWVLGRAVLPRYRFLGNVALTGGCCLACLALGFMMTAVVGEIIATAIASFVFLTMALVRERRGLAELLRTFIGVSKPKVGSNADADARA